VTGRKPKTISIMQPYLFPYAGYFRLLSQVDEFVIYDCVQFPRRGRVHRTEVPGPAGAVEWLTLPLAPSPRETLIEDLSFAPGARESFSERLARLRWIHDTNGAAADTLREYLFGELGDVVSFLERGLRLSADLLGIKAAISRSSTLGIDASLRSEERVLAIAAAVGATDYLNAPGGRALYDRDRFDAAAINLSFLPPYQGPYQHMLHDLMSSDLADIRADIDAA